MFFKNCIDLFRKQILLPRSLLVVGPQPATWYSKSSLLLPPPPPKRNKSAWVFYLMENYPRVKKENPAGTKTEIYSQLSDGWRQLERSAAEKYHQLALVDKEKYQEEIESYRANLTPEMKLSLAKEKLAKKKKPDQKKQLRALGMPKRPPNGYILFHVDYVKKNCETGRDAFKDSVKVGAVWRDLPLSEKSKWNDLAASKHEQYRKELEEWEKDMTAKGHLEIFHTRYMTKK